MGAGSLEVPRRAADHATDVALETSGSTRVRRSRSRAGTALDAVVLVLLVALLLLGALRWWDSTNEYVVVAQTLGPFVVIGVTLLTVVVVVLRRWRAAVAAVLATIAVWAFVLPAFLSSADAGPEAKAGVNLRVLSLNMRYGQARAEQVMDAVRARQADVLMLVEVTPEALDRLDELGLTRLLPHRTGEARPDAVTGTMILSRLPLADPVLDPGNDEAGWSREPEATVTVSGTPVRLKAAHPTAPYGGGLQSWRAGLRQLAQWRDAQPPDRAIVLGGDFNADVGHPGFRTLAEGLQDAPRTAGLGWVRTWPVADQRVPPYVQLDHLLSRGVTVVAAGVTYVNGTDHALVWADYRVGA